MNKIEDEHSSGYSEIYSWGSDRFGQLGLGNKIGLKNFVTPTFYSFNVIITEISAGEEHSAFITSYGTIFTIGSNSEGRLGIGEKTIKQSSSPCLVETLSKLSAKSISCGWGHTAAIFSNGEIYTWGVGEYGALGISGNSSQWLPVKVQFSSKEKITITNLSAGTRHTAVIDERGKLYTFGSGDAGQLGTGSKTKEEIPFLISSINEKLSSVSCGVFHTLVLSDSGKVYGMGGNNFGQLGIGTKRSSTVPIKIQELEYLKITKISASQFSAAISESGDLFVWGYCTLGEYLKPKKVEIPSTKFVNVTLGGTIGISIDSNGQGYGWGKNSSGELGLGDYDQRKELCPLISLKDKKILQISVGGSYCIAIGKTVSKLNIDLNKISSESNSRFIDNSPSELSKPNDDPYHSMRNDQLDHNFNLSRISQNVKNDNLTNYDIITKDINKLKEFQEKDFPKLSNHNRQKTPINYISQLKYDEISNNTANKSNVEFVTSLVSQRDQLMNELKKEKQKNEKIHEEMNSNSNRQDKKKIAYVSKDEHIPLIINEEIKTINEKIKFMENEKKMLEENLFINQENFQNVTREMDSAKENIASLNNQIKEMNDVMNEQEAENVSLKEELKKLVSDLKNKNIENEKEKEKNELIEIERNKFENELANINQIVNQKTNEISELTIDLRNSNGLLESKDKELKAVQELYQKEIENLTNKINNLSSKFDKEKEEKLAENENIAKIKSENEMLKEKVEQYKQMIDIDKSNSSKLNSEHTELNPLLKVQETELNTIKKKLEDQKSAFVELESKYNSTNENSDKNKNPSLTSENKILKNKNLSLQKEIEAIKKRNINLEDQISNLQMEVASWNQISDSLSKENSELKKKCEIIEDKNKKLGETLNSHINSKATDYKERAITKLKASNSPHNFQSVFSSRPGLPYQKLSPIRLQEIINEENALKDKKLNTSQEVISQRKNDIEMEEHKMNANELSHSFDSSNMKAISKESIHTQNQEINKNSKKSYDLVDSFSGKTLDLRPSRKDEAIISRNIVEKSSLHTPSLSNLKREINYKNINKGEFSTGKSKAFQEFKTMQIRDLKKQDLTSNYSKFDNYKMKPGKKDDLKVYKSSFNLSMLNSQSIRENLSNLKSELNQLQEDRNFVYGQLMEIESNTGKEHKLSK